MHIHLISRSLFFFGILCLSFIVGAPKLCAEHTVTPRPTESKGPSGDTNGTTPSGIQGQQRTKDKDEEFAALTKEINGLAHAFNKLKEGIEKPHEEEGIIATIKALPVGDKRWMSAWGASFLLFLYLYFRKGKKVLEVWEKEIEATENPQTLNKPNESSKDKANPTSDETINTEPQNPSGNSYVDSETQGIPATPSQNQNDKDTLAVGEPQKSSESLLSRKQKAQKFCIEHGLQILLLIEGGLLMILCSSTNWHKIEVADKVADALVIAAVVSWLFDVAYHRQLIGKPVEEMRQAVQETKGLTKDTEQNLNRLSAAAERTESSASATAQSAQQATEGVNRIDGAVTLLSEKTTEANEKIEQAKSGVGKIDETVARLTEVTSETGLNIQQARQGLEKIDDTVARLSNALGYLPFRGKILKRFETSERRIVSISDYWATDLSWWQDVTKPDKTRLWQKTHLYESLLGALSRKDCEDQEELKSLSPQILFGGRGVWPTYSGSMLGRTGKREEPQLVMDMTEHRAGNVPQFSPADMRCFLGILWRLIVCHKVRNEVRRRYKEELILPSFKGKDWDKVVVPLNVVVASAPIQATIVDDEVFVLFPGEDPKDVFVSRVFHITPHDAFGMPVGERQVDVADAYISILSRSLRSARSAREYVQSIFVLSMNADSNIFIGEELGHEEPDLESMPLARCLRNLGLEEWAIWECGRPKDETLSLNRNTEELMNAAYYLANEFRLTLNGAAPLRHRIENRLQANPNGAHHELTFNHLMEDLF